MVNTIKTNGDISSIMLSGEVVAPPNCEILEIGEKKTLKVTMQLCVKARSAIPPTIFNILAVEKAAKAIMAMKLEAGDKLLISNGLVYFKDDQWTVRVENRSEVTFLPSLVNGPLNLGTKEANEEFI